VYVFFPFVFALSQTQSAMERTNIGNVRSALEKSRLLNVVPEQAHMQ
jgi:hypothetical protein